MEIPDYLSSQHRNSSCSHIRLQLRRIYMNNETNHIPSFLRLLEHMCKIEDNLYRYTIKYNSRILWKYDWNTNLFQV